MKQAGKICMMNAKDFMQPEQNLNNHGLVSFVIAAAGKGSRANLPYPKCLFKVDNKEILLRILDAFPENSDITLITSPSGNEMIQDCIKKNKHKARFIIQENPTGMGDAVLQLKKANKMLKDHILLTWGDLPFLSKQSIEELIDHYFFSKSDFSFITNRSELAYTIVKRDSENKVIEIIETRESNTKILHEGERDIGVFIFKKSLIFDYLSKNLPGKIGKNTGEHGFLYIVKHLIKGGYTINTIQTINDKEAVSFNSLEDLT